MKVDVLLGLQWGDEGKGKVVDVLTPKYNIIARFQGGPNAGHTLRFNGNKYTLHLIPSGIFHSETLNIIGNGVVLDPVIFKQEILALNKSGVDTTKNLFISNKTHLILPTHRILDAESESSKGISKIGSTLKGISPAYSDVTARNGLRIGDINSEFFVEKYNTLKQKHLKLLKNSNFEFDIQEYEKLWFEGIEFLKGIIRIDTEQYVNKALRENKSILAEGAQGTMLDINFGSYPFVTSSNTVSAGACLGLGVAPSKIGEVFGIFKAYCTRVGSGPFPTELFDEVGLEMQQIGQEIGATTGRVRRCGWLDLPALKYAVEINGVTQLIMTKADVMNSFEKIKICTGYIKNGKIIDYMPYELEEKTEVIYREFEGWQTDIRKITNFENFPTQLKDYVKFIETELNVPITIISTGPDRTETVFK